MESYSWMLVTIRCRGEKAWIMKCRHFAARRNEIGILVQHEVKHHVGENPPLVDRVILLVCMTSMARTLIYELVNIHK